MFKKPLSNLKTSAPLRSSDRRKLRQRVVAAFGVQPDEGDLLVPDGIESLKFSTHLDEPGVAYLSKEGDPLWFTIGKGSEDLVPTVYTLWKKADLLPFLSTPAAVIPVLTGGADLMIPGVVHCAPALPAGALVGIRQWSRNEDGKTLLSAPLAVGRMALPSDQLTSGGRVQKGKAALVLHVWKDHLWDMGSKPDALPEDTILGSGVGGGADGGGEEPGTDAEDGGGGDDASHASPPPPSEEGGEVQGQEVKLGVSYTPQEISNLLQKALLQAIASTLVSAPPSTFPIPATLFYTNYILPCRPAFPTFVLPPSALPEGSDAGAVHIDPQEINIKASTHKSLTALLKAADKAGLLSLKQPQKHSQQTDSLVMSVNAKSPLVLAHTAFPTVRDIEEKAAKKAAREDREKKAETSGELGIRELWKPHLGTVELFKGFGRSPATLYTPTEVRSIVFDYVAEKDLVNKGDKSYINLDALLRECLVPKPSAKASSKGKEPQADADFMKRDEVVKKVLSKMQTWYEIVPPGKDPVQKKGQLKPIQVVIKIRQGRKASTMITGFEPFVVVDGEEMAEDLRKSCAGATSVSPAAGKAAGSGMEVLVQGKQGPAVVEYLMGKGIPKRWIEVIDLAGKK